MFYSVIRFIFKITLLKAIFKKTNFMQTIFDNRYDPATVRFPFIDKNMESNISGVHLVGDISGTPLLKNGINMGYEVVDLFKEQLKSSKNKATYDILIVGAGGSGLSAAMRAKELGFRCVVIEQGYQIAQTIQKFARGKKILAEPLSVELKGNLFLADSTTKEELLDKWDKQVKAAELDIRFGEQVVDLQPQENQLLVRSSKSVYTAKKVILAIGKAGNPRKIGCTGDNLPKNSHFLADADLHNGEDIIIYGGGDVAMEAGIALAENNNVTIVTIDKELVFPRKRNKDQVMQLKKEGKLELLLNTKITSVATESVSIENFSSKEKQTLTNNRLFTMIGADLPLKFFQQIKLKLERTWNLKRWLYLLGIFVFVYLIYAVDKNKFFPIVHGGKISAWLKNVTGFQGYDWYAVFYTLVMVVFGSMAAMRWAKTVEERKWSKMKKRLCLMSNILLFLFPPALLFILSRGHFGAGPVADSLGPALLPLYVALCLVVVLINIFIWTRLKWDRIKLQGWRFGALLFVQILLFGLGSVYGAGKYGHRESKKWASHSYKLVYNGPLSPNAMVEPFVRARYQVQKAQQKNIEDKNTAATSITILNTIEGKVLIFSIAFTIFLIPLVTIFFGKGFCTWVCGCGGLAETLGDRWRHYSPKGKKSIALEVQGAVITIVFFLLIGWMFYRILTTNYAIDPRFNGTSGVFYGIYLAVVDWWLIGILPVAFYPFFGGKVWCRYWCPLAKYMQWWSKMWRKIGIGRYSIRAKEGCITCGECSKYCQVGIDVQTFAKNEDSFDNRNSSCIACGICVAVCPMDVLEFHNKRPVKKNNSV